MSVHPRLPEQVQHVHAADARRRPARAAFRRPRTRRTRRTRTSACPTTPWNTSALNRSFFSSTGRIRLSVSASCRSSRLPGQHRRLRIAVHGVRVLAEDAVHQPAAGRPRVLRIAALARLLHLLPVPQLPELLVVDDAPVQILLAAAGTCRRISAARTTSCVPILAA